jgi:hypothetical protein
MTPANTEFTYMPIQYTDEVSSISRWKARLKREVKSQLEWQDTWGFLAKKPTDIHALDGPAYQPLTRLDAQLAQLRPPRSKYPRPLLSSHHVGWRPSIELFGVNHFGLKNN